MPEGTLTPPLALFGAVCFAVQILFDFSGYTDMAIGIARAVGFDFPENFNEPYRASSIQDFWRRWHMTLSRWFRDYCYIPLGGNRKGPVRTYVNLITVFFLTGLWHGASWNFIIWGLYHGCFLIIERLGLKSLLDRAPRPVQLLYVWVVVLIGWVWFRAESLMQGWDMSALLLFRPAEWTRGWSEVLRYAAGDDLAALGAGLFISVGGWHALRSALGRREGHTIVPEPAFGWARSAALATLSLVCIAAVTSQTQQAFIYFRF